MKQRFWFVLPTLIVSCSSHDSRRETEPPVQPPKNWNEMICSDFHTPLSAADRDWADGLIANPKLLAAPFRETAQDQTTRDYRTRQLILDVRESVLQIKTRHHPEGHTETFTYKKSASADWVLSTYHLAGFKESTHSTIDQTYKAQADHCFIEVAQSVRELEGWSESTWHWNVSASKRELISSGVNRGIARAGHWDIERKEKWGETEHSNVLRVDLNDKGQVVAAEGFYDQRLMHRHRFTYQDDQLQSWITEKPEGDAFARTAVVVYDWKAKKRKSITKDYQDLSGTQDTSILQENTSILQMNAVPFDPRTCSFSLGTIDESCFVTLANPYEIFKFQGVEEEDTFYPLRSTGLTFGAGYGFSTMFPGIAQTGVCQFNEQGLDCQLDQNRYGDTSVDCQEADLNAADIWSQSCPFTGEPRLRTTFLHSIKKQGDDWVYEKTFSSPTTRRITRQLFDGSRRVREWTETRDGVTTKTCNYAYRTFNSDLLGMSCQDSTVKTRLEATD